ncbi:TadE/TadG family type IV pilus assembly protein [Sinosporangium siamense]|uniref:TadE-like domain-containing protein n=1 Tax=Sinosporangium siamense TaxID=1367973 RepID=A0A919VAB7_9ACTN|nr:TadE/TadG family type IV pilus assembly protein [Sinosporangium siamense]GII90949.1 hypothetical protein Ssi02_11800 [Sinosporangium siamense]
MSAETVLLAPVFILFLMFLVGAGRVVEAQGEVNGAARDAARAASVERSRSSGQDAARRTARSVLEGQCGAPSASVRWDLDEETGGGHVRVEVGCELDLGFLGFGLSRRMTAVSVVPLERFRRFG